MSDSNNQHDVLAQHDPATLQARELAELRARLREYEQGNVVEGRFHGEMPRYKLNEPCFLDNTFFEADTELDWTDTPNMAMVPLNEPARARLQEEIDRQIDGARRQAERAGREFFGLTTDRGVLIAQANQDARYLVQAEAPRTEMPRPRSEVPAMPHTEQAQQMQRRGPGRPKTVRNVVPPSAQAPRGSVPNEMAPTTVRGPAGMTG